MTVIAAILATGYPLTIWLTLHHLRARDTAERTERAILLQRIQAPEAAIAEHAANLAPDEPDTRPLDDTDYWTEAERKLAGFQAELGG